MFNSVSPGVVIGDMIVLTEEGLESPFHWEISFVAVSKVPFSNLGALNIGIIVKQQLFYSPDVFCSLHFARSPVKVAKMC